MLIMMTVMPVTAAMWIVELKKESIIVVIIIVFQITFRFNTRRQESLQKSEHRFHSVSQASLSVTHKMCCSLPVTKHPISFRFTTRRQQSLHKANTDSTMSQHHFQSFTRCVALCPLPNIPVTCKAHLWADLL